MHNGVMESLKTRIWDFKTSAFLSTFLFAWIYWNSKLILIFTSSKLNIDKKIQMLSWHDINYEFPLWSALAYVIAFPILNTLLYGITLIHLASKNWVQQKIQDETPLPQEKAKELYRENTKLHFENDEMSKQINDIKVAYSTKEETLASEYEIKNKAIDETINNQVQNQISESEQRVQTLTKIKEKQGKVIITLKGKEEANKALLNEVKQLKNDLILKGNEIAQITAHTYELNDTISRYELQLKPIQDARLKRENLMKSIDDSYLISQNSETEEFSNLTKEQIIILYVFLAIDSIIKTSTIKDYATKEFGMMRAIVGNRLIELMDKEFISRNASDYYYLEPKGSKALEVLF